MGLKIIHCADVHFDSAMSGIADISKVNIRREDMKETFKKIISLSKSADMLLISGDLFDGENVSKSTLAFLREEFSKIPDTGVFICAGNHDYMGKKSPYLSFDFGENVHIFKTEWECIEFKDADVYGVSFKTANDERELLPEISIKNPDKINICVMHGNLSGQDYNPVKISDIENSGFDYIALGHIHKASEVKCAKNTNYAYPGCPEGRGNDETGVKGVYALEIEKGNLISSEFVSVCKRVYIDEEVDITGCSDYEEIYEKIKNLLTGDKNIYRITLTGESDLSLDTEILKNKIEAFLVTIRDNTTPKTDLHKLSEEFSLKGLFAKFALSDKENLSDEEFNDAVKAGLNYILKEENNENR